MRCQAPPPLVRDTARKRATMGMTTRP